jgi:hypothetical protein
MRFIRALRVPQIALLWTGQVLSAPGDSPYTIAMLWIAVRTSGSHTGPGGVCADCWKRRRTMITVDLVQRCVISPFKPADRP